MQNLPLRNVENQPETVRTSETGKNPAGITLTEHQHSALNMLKKFLNKETGFRPPDCDCRTD
jgi:hypothetical protein